MVQDILCADQGSSTSPEWRLAHNASPDVWETVLAHAEYVLIMCCKMFSSVCCVLVGSSKIPGWMVLDPIPHH